MKAALVVHRVTGNREADLASMEAAVRRSGEMHAELALFGEAAPTGLLNDDNPAHDLPLGTPIPGPVTERLALAAGSVGVWVATGLLERDGDVLYDSAVLIDRTGGIVLHYRRIQPQWHGRRADPEVYREGDTVEAVDTPLGRLSVLLCGDLFDDEIVAEARRLKPDYVLFPFARNFDDGSFDEERWVREERGAYAARAVALGCTTLMVNLLVDPAFCDYPSFGAAMVVSRTGKILADLPPGRDGILLADV